MNYIEQAIRKAVEAGYDKFIVKGCDKEIVKHLVSVMVDINEGTGELEKHFLDPLFWQALGKAMGWDKEMTYYNTFTEGKENNDPWRLYWHRFIDHLAEGKNAEDYFKDLLSK